MRVSKFTTTLCFLVVVATLASGASVGEDTGPPSGVVIPQVLFGLSEETVVGENVPCFYSERWPRELRDFARWEWSYGDRAIDKKEAIYLARMVCDTQGWRGEDDLRRRVEAASGLLFLCRKHGDHESEEVIVREVAERSPAGVPKVRKWMETATRQYNMLSLYPFSNRCRNIHLMRGKIRTFKTQETVIFPYRLSGAADAETMTHYIQYNPEYGFLLLDALRFSEEWRYEACATFLTSSLSDRSLRPRYFRYAASLLKYMRPDQSYRTMKKLRTIVPGEASHIDATSREEQYYGLFNMALRAENLLPRRRRDYWKIRDDDEKLATFFKRRGTFDDGWLLYRHHPDLVRPLTEEFLKSKEVQTQAVRSSLRSVFQHAELYDGYLTKYEKLRSRIKEVAFHGERAVQRANALGILRPREEDAEALLSLARDDSVVEYVDGGKRKDGPLVALRAVLVIDQLNRLNGGNCSGLLRQVALDERTPKEAASSAATHYEVIEGEPPGGEAAEQEPGSDKR